LVQAEKALAELETTPEKAPVFNLDGRDTLLAHAQTTIDTTQRELLIALQPPDAKELAPHLLQARQRGVAITTLCMSACQQECGGCQGHIHRYNMADNQSERWLLVTSDQSRAIAGEIGRTRTSSISTQHGQIIELIAAYIRQSLA